MNSNRSALDALAQEGILMTEEQLLKETQKVQSNGNGVTPSHSKVQVVYNNGISPTTTAGNTKPSSGRPHEGSAQSRPAASALPGATGEAQLVTRRGRQRTPKPWLMAVLCRLGMHEGPWAFVAEGNCTQGRECVRCGSVHARTRHEKWGASYSVGQDREAHQCERCGVVEEWTLSDPD